MVHEPAEVDRLDAEVMVGLLARMLERQRELEMFALAEPAEIVALYEQVWDSPVAAVLEREVSSDPDAFIAESRSALREGIVPAWAIEAFPGLLAVDGAPAPADRDAPPTV